MKRRSSAYEGQIAAVVLLCCLFLATLVAFQPCVSLPFVDLDDGGYLGEGSPVRHGLTWAGLLFSLRSTSHMYWHPLTWASYMLDTELFGFSEFAIHRTNIVLHALTAAGVAALIARLAGSWWWGILAAFMWAVHPLRVESVAWAAERKDVLSGALFIAALLAHLKHLDTRRPLYSAFSLAAGCLAMMAKPTTVVLPLIMVVLDKSRAGAAWNWRRTAAHVPALLCVAAAVSALTVIGQSSAGALDLVDRPAGFRAANALVSSAEYLRRAAWPSGLACHYPYPAGLNSWAVTGAVAVLAGLGLAAWRLRAKRSYLLWGLCFYVLALLPTLGLIQAGRQASADRFTYLPAIGLAWILASLLREASAGSPCKAGVLSVAALAAVGLLAYRTQVQIETWRSSRALFQNALDAGSTDAFILGNLGAALMAEGRNLEAARHLREAARLEPDRDVHWRNLGWALARAGDMDGARRASEELLARSPGDAEGHFLQGRLAIIQRDFPLAITCLGRAMSHGWPSRKAAVLLHDAGITLAREGKLEQAQALIQRAVDLQPDMPQLRRSLAEVQRSLAE